MKKHPTPPLNSQSPPARVQSDTARRGELARLMPLWPRDLADLSIPGRRRIIRLIERALRTERCRGRAGHWAYDLSRHAALHRTWKSESAALHELENQNRAKNSELPSFRPSRS